jgi:hypothetical protein
VNTLPSSLTPSVIGNPMANAFIREATLEMMPSTRRSDPPEGMGTAHPSRDGVEAADGSMRVMVATTRCRNFSDRQYGRTELKAWK